MRTGGSQGGRIERARGVVVLVVVAALAAACGNDDAAPPDGPPAGYVRYEAPTIMVQPGENKSWIQWVALPLEKEQSVVDVIGYQGIGGHHAILYHTANVQPVGTTRVFVNTDQEAMQLVGGVGGEAGASVKLPEGVVMRVPAGRALVIQNHFFNTTDAPIEGKAHIDVKLAEPADSDVVARFFTNVIRDVDIPPDSHMERDAPCVLAHDLPMLMYSNHMHEWGVSAKTTITSAGGTPTVVWEDPEWSAELTFNPVMGKATAAKPLVLAAGSTLNTHCEWQNTTAAALKHPDEMCVFYGFFIGTADAKCVNGHWLE